LLDRRAELRGRLDAYRAKAERLGLAEDLNLAALHKQAHDVLYTRPTDLAAVTKDRVLFWSALADDQGRGRRQAELDEEVASWTRRFPLEELAERLAAAGVPAGPVYDIAGICRDPHFRDRGMAVELDDPEVGPLSLPGIVPRFSRTPAALAWAGPRMGEHNGEVYGGLLGLAPSEVDDLRARGVI